MPTKPNPEAAQSAPSNDAPRSGGKSGGFLHWNRRLAHWARWLHTYLSMLSFAILLFFALTGLTLNHADWFTEGKQRTVRFHGTVDSSLLHDSNAPKGVDVARIATYLRGTNDIHAGLSDSQVDDVQCQLSFKGPGYEADAIVDRDTGKYDLTVNRFGAISVLNDLHKGRDTGGSWSVLIDAAAIFMSLVALTGLTLIFYLTKRRVSGLVAIAAGALLCYLIYSVWVP
jgi:hypothetical protein